MLKQRLITAFVLLAILISIFMLASASWLRVSVFLVTSVAALEWADFSPSPLPRKIFTVLAILACSLAAYTLPMLWFGWLVCLFWLGMSYFVLRFPRYNYLFEKYWWFNLLVGILLLAPLGRAVTDVIFNLPLLITENGRLEMLSVLLLISAVDSGAYFAGRNWGKTRLAAQISPGKTCEGLLGGVACAAVLLLGSTYYQHFDVTHSMAVICIGIFLSLVAVMGDLVESMMKRIYQVKDSGSILPGHGGILDRIDSATAVLPIYAVILYIVK